MDFENWRKNIKYRIVGRYYGEKLELTSNIPSIEIAEKLRGDYAAFYPFFDGLTIEEYLTYHL